MCSGQAFLPTRFNRSKQNLAVGILRQFEHVHEVASASITMAVILSRADSSSVFTEDPACSTGKTDIRANRIGGMIFPFACEGVCVEEEQLWSGLGRVYQCYEE